MHYTTSSMAKEELHLEVKTILHQKGSAFKIRYFNATQILFEGQEWIVAEYATLNMPLWQKDFLSWQ